MTEPAADDGMLDALRQVPGAIWRTYLAPDAKTMFMSLNKNACTSLKWMMADLAGEDLSTFTADWQPFVVDSEAVHDRDLWKVSPKLDRLPADQRAALEAGDWFVFAVVRDPRLRLFSAWQNKLLIETPNSQRWAKEWWYPRHPMTTESVIEDFAKFVDLFEREPDQWLRAQDGHFRDQVEMLVESAVPYDRIYEISEIAGLRSDLTAHLEAIGRPSTLHLPRANPTPLRAIGALFENGVRERIERIYAADFERFGDVFAEQWDFSRTMAAEPWRDVDIATCENEAALGLRIAVLHRMARTERKEKTAALHRVAELEQQLTDLEARPRRGIRSAMSRLRVR